MNKRHGTDQPDAVEELLRLAPVREAPPADDTAAIREAVHAAWRQETRKRHHLPLRWAWAAAAGLAITVAVLVLRQTSVEPLPGAPLAHVDQASGNVAVTRAGRELPLSGGAGLSAGERVAIAPGARLSLDWAGGAQLRFDQDSAFEVLSAAGLKLSRGGVYVDTGAAGPPAQPAIVTSQGTVRHIGTRYQVRIAATATEVWVREGEVALHPAEHPSVTPLSVSGGQRLSVEHDGQVSVSEAPTWGEAWRWVDASTPPFSGDGRTVAELLEWVARESGRELVFVPAGLRHEADAVLLHGELVLGIDDALSVVNGTTDFRAHIEGERIEVTLHTN